MKPWGAVALVLMLAGSAQAQTEAWQQLVNQPNFRHATLTFALRNVETGDLVLDYNASASMVPASTLKLLPTAYALAQFPPDHRWLTQLVLPQGITNGVAPQVALIGSGDPTLGSPQISGNPDTATLIAGMVAAIAGAGIRQIETLVVDTSAIAIEPIPRSWTYDDTGNYYGASVTGLNINDNLYQLNLRPAAVGEAVTLLNTEPPTPWLRFTSYLRTGTPDSGDQGYIFGQPGDDARLIRGTVPAGGDYFIYGSLPDPADAMLRWLEADLNRVGIAVGTRQVSTVPLSGQEIWQHRSPTLAAIVDFTLSASMNLYADTLLVLAAQQNQASIPDWATATGAARTWMQQNAIETSGLRLEDGSGLSRRNLVTAAAMSDLVAFAARQPWWSTYQTGLRSPDGQLRPAGSVRGKNGFIAGVRTFSGVIQTRSQQTYAFSILINHLDGSIAAADSAISTFLDAIWEAY